MPTALVSDTVTDDTVTDDELTALAASAHEPHLNTILCEVCIARWELDRRRRQDTSRYGTSWMTNSGGSAATRRQRSSRFAVSRRSR